AQRSIGSDRTAASEFLDSRAYFIEHRTFGKALPCRHQPESRHAIFPSLTCRFEHGVGVYKSVARRIGLIKRRLRAKLAVLRTSACLCIHNRAKVNLVPFEVFANPIGPR